MTERKTSARLPTIAAKWVRIKKINDIFNKRGKLIIARPRGCGDEREQNTGAMKRFETRITAVWLKCEEKMLSDADGTDKTALSICALSLCCLISLSHNKSSFPHVI